MMIAITWRTALLGPFTPLYVRRNPYQKIPLFRGNSKGKEHDPHESDFTLEELA